MAVTSMLTTNPLTVKKWEIKGFLDMYKRTAFGHMARRGTIMRAEELDRAQAGDEVTFSFTGILTGVGVTEGGTLEGNEEALDLQADTMLWNEVRHAVRSPSEYSIEQTRTYVNFEDRARQMLPKWHASRVDASVFNQLAGVDSTSLTTDDTVYTGSARTIVLGLNGARAPTANRIIRAGGAANDESIANTDTMTLDLIDAAVELLARTYPHVEALEGEEFDLYISHEQATDLKRDTSGRIQWYVNNLSAMEGGMIGDNPIMNVNHYSMKPIGKYANVYIYAYNRVAVGENSATQAPIANVRRAVLCGKNAMAFASKFSGALTDGPGATAGNVPLQFSLKEFDYEHRLGVAATMIYGVRKIQFDGEDYGSCVISTFAAPHTS